MKEWILSVGAVSVICVIIGVIIPEGKTGKLIKWLSSLSAIFVILSPIKNIAAPNMGFIYSAEQNLVPDYDYVYFTIEKRIENEEKTCERIFEDKGIFPVKVSLEYSVNEDYSHKVQKATVNFENSVMNFNDEHRIIIEECRKNVAEYLNVKNEAVTINE